MEVLQFKSKFEVVDRGKGKWQITLECGHTLDAWTDTLDRADGYERCRRCEEILKEQLTFGPSLSREIETLSKYFTLADESGYNPHEVIAWPMAAIEVQPEHAPETAKFIRRRNNQKVQAEIEKEIKK